MPFDLQLEPYDRRGWRYKRTLGDPKWWEHRADVMRNYVVPGLLNLADRGFEVFVSFFPEHLRSGDAQPMLRALQRVPNRVIVAEDPMDRSGREFLFSGTRMFSVAERYHDRCAWVVTLWLDSDDIYHREVWKHVKAVKPEEGLAIGFDDGYTYDTRDGRLYGWLGGPSGPPPFFAYCWPNRVLGSYEEMKAYARASNYTCVHHLLNRCPKKVWLRQGLFCALMTGGNCTKDIHWKGNRFIRYHIRSEVTGERRGRILSQFGIKEGKRG